MSPDPAESKLLDYSTLSTPLANQVIGSIKADITSTANTAGESALGDVIADAQVAATSSATTGNAVVAMTNPGGIRTDLLNDAATLGRKTEGERQAALECAR